MNWEINENMMCPKCKGKLTIDLDEPTFQYEDAALSNIITNKYICTDSECICSQKKCFWNDYGDYWSGSMKTYEHEKKVFPDGKYAALNSMAKRQEVEIYGKGLKRKIYLSPWLTLKWLQPMIEFKYKGDEMGNVLGRSWKLIFLYKDSDRDYYSVHYTSPIMTCIHLIKSNYRHINQYKNSKSNYTLTEIYRWYNMGNHNGWERRLPKWFFRNFYGKYLDWSKNTIDFFKHIRRYPDITEDFFNFWVTKLPPEIDILKEVVDEKCTGDYINQKIRERKLKRILK